MTIIDKLKSMVGLSDAAPEPMDKFYVPMPEAGKNVYIYLHVDALAQLERDFGDDYWNLLSLGFQRPSPMIISRFLALTLHNADSDGAPWGLSLEELGKRCFDAQIRVYKGISLEEAMMAIKEQEAAKEAAA